jgi:hypothetical protein
MIPRVRILSLLAVAALLGAAACSKLSTKDQPDPEPDTEYHEFPIVAWTGIDANDADAKFGPMKEAGFNVYLGWYDSIEEVETVLTAAEKHGVKVITRSKFFLSDPVNEVNRIKERKGLFGYFLADEPEVSDLRTLGEIMTKVQNVDGDHPCYINLYPNWAWGGVNSYISRLSGYLSVVPAPFISFDFYPILEIEGKVTIRDGWYKNLEDVRRMSRAKKLPFWAFALSLASSGGEHPTPTLSDLRLQQFVNLVYGAQAFQYWTYWGIYHSSPTAVYNPAKQVNKELQVLARYFYGADVTNVWHTGGDIPAGTVELTEMPESVTKIVTGGPAIVSRIENNGRTYIAIVNKNCRQRMSLSIAFDKTVEKYDHSGYKTTVSESDTTLEAGDIIVFQTK